MNLITKTAIYLESGDKARFAFGIVLFVLSLFFLGTSVIYAYVTWTLPVNNIYYRFLLIAVLDVAIELYLTYKRK